MGEVGPAFGRGHRCQEISRVQNSLGQPFTLAGSSKALEEAKWLCFVGDAFPPESTARGLGGLAPGAFPRIFQLCVHVDRTGFPEFAFIGLRRGRLTSFLPTEFGARTLEAALCAFPSGWEPAPRRLRPRLLSSPSPPAPTFHSAQVAGTEDAQEGRSISAGLLPGAAGAGPWGGREGRERAGLCCPPRDWVRTGSARPGARGGRGMDRAARALGGRTAGARAGGGLPASDPACEPGEDGGDSGRQPGRTSGLRRGALRGLSGPGQGGRAGRAEAPGGATRVPREPALVSQLPPGPRRRAGVEAGAGRGAGRATQSFQRQFQRVGRDRLHGGARTRGTSDSRAGSSQRLIRRRARAADGLGRR